VIRSISISPSCTVSGIYGQRFENGVTCLALPSVTFHSVWLAAEVDIIILCIR